MQKVPLAMFADRTTVSSLTGVTPFKGVFGVDSRVPLDVIFPPPQPPLSSGLNTSATSSNSCRAFIKR